MCGQTGEPERGLEKVLDRRCARRARKLLQVLNPILMVNGKIQRVHFALCLLNVKNSDGGRASVTLTRSALAFLDWTQRAWALVLFFSTRFSLCLGKSD
jgi:hypothetical protein